MENIVNQEFELNYLKEQYNSKKSSLIIIYGRRRLGKSTLIKEFIKDVDYSLYLACTTRSEKGNKRQFLTKLADLCDNPILINVNMDWTEIFKYLAEFKKEEKKVIVFDEFQYLGMTNRDLLITFQAMWDEFLSESNVMLILCGSLIDKMLNQTLYYTSPLYGRRTGTIYLQQLAFRHMKELLPNHSDEELIKAYGVFGGSPFYLNLYNSYNDITAAIKELIFNESSLLHNEPTFLLQEEVKDISTYFEILFTLSSGINKLSDISSAMHKKPSNLIKSLNILIELDLVKREVPITENNIYSSKLGIYKIKDNLINFWFKYHSIIQLDDKKTTDDERILGIESTFYTSYLPLVYEDICIQRLGEFSSENKLPFKIGKCGRYWDNIYQINLIGHGFGSNNSNCIIGECKYTKNLVGISTYDSLIIKRNYLANIIPNYNISCLIIFSLSGFTKELLERAKNGNSLILVRCLDLIQQ